MQIQIGSQDDLTLDADQLALVLKKSVAAIRGDLSRAPHRLPPVIRIPGGRKALWLRQSVVDWLKGIEVGRTTASSPASPALPLATPSQNRRGRGRPRKSDASGRVRKAA